MKVVVVEFGWSLKMIIPISKLQALGEVISEGQPVDNHYEGGVKFFTKSEAVNPEITFIDSGYVYETKEAALAALEQAGKLSEEYLDKREAKQLAETIGGSLTKPDPEPDQPF